jgi:hypothetical protein
MIAPLGTRGGAFGRFIGGRERWPQSPPSPPNIMPCNCEVHGMHADTIKK